MSTKSNDVAGMKLTVVMVNSWPKACEIIHTGATALVDQCRTVHIELTDDQLEQLRPQQVGNDRGPVYEQFGPAWLERPLPDADEKEGE